MTGSPRLLGLQHLRAHHRLVVDGGFAPQPDGTVLGDVQAEAYDAPQAVTPIPAGSGRLRWLC